MPPYNTREDPSPYIRYYDPRHYTHPNANKSQYIDPVLARKIALAALEVGVDPNRAAGMAVAETNFGEVPGRARSRDNLLGLHWPSHLNKYGGLKEEAKKWLKPGADSVENALRFLKYNTDKYGEVEGHRRYRGKGDFFYNDPDMPVNFDPMTSTAYQDRITELSKGFKYNQQYQDILKGVMNPSPEKEEYPPDRLWF